MTEGPNLAQHDALYALALRLLAYNYPGQPGLDDTRLFVGALPPDLPEALPIPAGAQLLGSLMRGRQQIDVVFDTTLTPDAVLAFYREGLATAGWRMPKAREHGGFAHGSPTRDVTFCRSERGPGLRVDAVPATGVTQVRLTVLVDERNRCGGAGRQDPFARIPPLTTPEGSEQRAMGGSGDGARAHATAKLTTDLEVKAVADHYRLQLDRVGWVQSEAGEAGPAAWAAYSFTDETGAPWRGSLFVMRQPGAPREYVLQVWVDAGEATTAPDGGWAAWARAG